MSADEYTRHLADCLKYAHEREKRLREDRDKLSHRVDVDSARIAELERENANLLETIQNYRAINNQQAHKLEEEVRLWENTKNRLF